MDKIYFKFAMPVHRNVVEVIRKGTSVVTEGFYF